MLIVSPRNLVTFWTIADTGLITILMSKMKLLLDFITALSGFTPTLTGMAVTPGWRLICSWWHLEARLFHGAGSIWLTRVKHEVNILQLFVLPISTILNRYLSSSELEEMVGREEFEPSTIRQSCAT